RTYSNIRRRREMDLLRDTFNLGLGALVFSKEKADKIVSQLVKKGSLKRNEGRKLVKEIVKKGEIERINLEKGLVKIIEQTVSKLNVAAKSDIRRLEKDIRQLRAKKAKR
ncbi:MAG: hypothetical protein PHP17_07325, partial [Candidatus Omnitrophica bacterium]|nr:hypothetical protein [Candidatus Omnitrophota bacterium]